MEKADDTKRKGKRRDSFETGARSTLKKQLEMSQTNKEANITGPSSDSEKLDQVLLMLSELKK